MYNLLSKSEEASLEMRNFFKDYILSEGTKIVNNPDLK
jgi:hypothetical protein